MSLTNVASLIVAVVQGDVAVMQDLLADVMHGLMQAVMLL